MASLALSRELLDVGASPRLPATIRFAGKAAGKAWIEFFTAQIRNANTRSAYHHACTQFFALIETTGLALVDIEAAHVAAYIEGLCHSHSAPTAKQHLAALRSLFDFMVVRQALPQNPAAAVRGPKHQVSEGKTPILSAEETRALFEQFDETRLIDVRDRAVVAVMVYSFARVGALTKMRVRDYYRQGAKAWFILDEKGGKQRRVPAHHQAAAYVEEHEECWTLPAGRRTGGYQCSSSSSRDTSRTSA